MTVKYMRLLALVCAFLLPLVACESPDKQAVRKRIGEAQETIKQLTDATDSTLPDIKKLSPDDALNEVKKLRQFEYKVVTFPVNATAEAITAKLAPEGIDGWECFAAHTLKGADGTDQLGLFCRRRPETPLRFVPQSFLSR
jgi:hypothetical protein